MAAQPSVCDFGWKARDFDLPATDGKRYKRADMGATNGLLVMFICNHCPYVKAIRERLVRDVGDLVAKGVGSVGIMSNDVADYPEDSFENMRRVSDEFHFPFPYIFDESQEVAKAYGAICTPDFFGFNRNFELRFRGRLDESRTAPAPNARRELFEGMSYVAATAE